LTANKAPVPWRLAAIALEDVGCADPDVVELALLFASIRDSPTYIERKYSVRICVGT
jgi:replication-associated recombination protein RarA